MSAQNEIAKALKEWLVHSSWYSAHPVDEGRFYRAMAAVIRIKSARKVPRATVAWLGTDNVAGWLGFVRMM